MSPGETLGWWRALAKCISPGLMFSESLEFFPVSAPDSQSYSCLEVHYSAAEVLRMVIIPLQWAETWLSKVASHHSLPASLYLSLRIVSLTAPGWIIEVCLHHSKWKLPLQVPPYQFVFMVESVFPISFYAHSWIVTVNERPEIFLKAVLFHEPQIFPYKRSMHIISFNDSPWSFEDQICSHVFKRFVNCQVFWQ